MDHTTPDKAQLPPLSMSMFLTQADYWKARAERAEAALSTVPAAAPQGEPLPEAVEWETLDGLRRTTDRKLALNWEGAVGVRVVRRASPTPPAAAEGALTDEQIEKIAREHGTGGWQTLTDMKSFARAVIAALSTAPAPEASSGVPLEPDFARVLFGNLDELYVDAAPTPAVAPSEARGAYHAACGNIADEAMLRRAVSVMDDVLGDIADWEDKALAESVEGVKTDLQAFIAALATPTEAPASALGAPASPSGSTLQPPAAASASIPGATACGHCGAAEPCRAPHCMHRR